MPRKHLAILLLAFLLSVLVRAPHIGRPLSFHHEYCTAMVLIFLHNWQDGGFHEHLGAPTWNFATEADRHVYPGSYAFATRDGYFYYLSFPPLAYYPPHVLFSLTGMELHQTPLTWMNMALHLLTLICLFQTMRICLDRWQPCEGIALVAAVLYLFMPASLWFHGNFYMSDIFIQPVWALHLLASVCLFLRPGPRRSGSFWAYGLTLGAAVYSYWLGLSIAAANVAALFLLRRDRAFRKQVLIVTAVAVLVPLLLFITQYAAVIGLEELGTYFWYRFQDRATMDFWEGGITYHINVLMDNYRIGWLPVLLLLGGCLLLQLLPGVSSGFKPNEGSKLYLLLTGLPFLLDHAVLLKHAGHDFATLKSGFFLSGLTAMLLYHLPVGRSVWRRSILVPAATIGTCMLGIVIFYRLNAVPGSGVDHDQRARWGRVIREAASPEEVVFALGWTPEPQEQWYARRNLKEVRSMEEAKAFLTIRGIGSGVVFSRQDDRLEHQRIIIGDTE